MDGVIRVMSVSRKPFVSRGRSAFTRAFISPPHAMKIPILIKDSVFRLIRGAVCPQEARGQHLEDRHIT